MKIVNLSHKNLSESQSSHIKTPINMAGLLSGTLTQSADGIQVQWISCPSENLTVILITIRWLKELGRDYQREDQQCQNLIRMDPMTRSQTRWKVKNK